MGRTTLTISQELMQEVYQAIENYVNDCGGWPKVSEERQLAIADIHKILNPSLNPVLVLHKLRKYVNGEVVYFPEAISGETKYSMAKKSSDNLLEEKMPACRTTLTGWMSRLRKYLTEILDQEKYQDAVVSARYVDEGKQENKKHNTIVWYKKAKEYEDKFKQRDAEFTLLKDQYTEVKKELRVLCKDNKSKESLIERYESALQKAGGVPKLVEKVQQLEEDIKRQRDCLSELQNMYQRKKAEADKLTVENKFLKQNNEQFEKIIELQKQEIEDLKTQLELLREKERASAENCGAQKPTLYAFK